MARQGSTDELFDNSIDDNETTDHDEFVPERDAIGAIGVELERAKCLETEAQQEVITGKTYQKVLRELLAQIERVDFRERAGLDEDDKIARKLYAVISIDEMIETAVRNTGGLGTKDGFIYVFNGKYWQVVNAGDFKPFLVDASMKMGVPVLEAKYHQFKDELYKQFLSASNLPTPEKRANVLINLTNGTFEITHDKQELREQRGEDFIKYQLPFEYNPAAQCPMFDKYLLRVVPDADCRKVLAEYLGYIFINNLKLEKALILYGSGANGKSVFFEIVNAILGEEISAPIRCRTSPNMTAINGRNYPTSYSTTLLRSTGSWRRRSLSSW
jgi:putative DNA primase/helicase